MAAPSVSPPTDRRAIRLRLLRALATAVIAASAFVTLTALKRDLRNAYAWAGPSIFTDIDRRQMAEVRETVPEGELIVLVARSKDHWYARLWQRGLYPRNPVAIQLDVIFPEFLAKLRKRYRIRWVVLVGPPENAPALERERDLGTLPGSTARVFFGEWKH